MFLLAGRKRQAVANKYLEKKCGGERSCLVANVKAKSKEKSSRGIRSLAWQALEQERGGRNLGTRGGETGTTD